MGSLAQAQTVVDLLDTLPLDHVAYGFGTSQICLLPELKENISGLRATCKRARALCDLLVQGVAVMLTGDVEATKQRVLGLKPFTHIQQLNLACDVSEDEEANETAHMQLGRFAVVWSLRSQARVRILTLCFWRLTPETMTLVAKAMPHLERLTLEGCETDDPLCLAVLAACSSLSFLKLDYYCAWDADDTAMLSELSAVGSLRSLDLRYNAGCLPSACLAGITQLTKLALWSTCGALDDPTPLSALKDLEELQLTTLDEGVPHGSLSACLRSLTALRKLDVPVLTAEDWRALQHTPVQEVVCALFHASPDDLPLQPLRTVRKVVFHSDNRIPDFVATSVVAVVGILDAIPTESVIELKWLPEFQDDLDGGDTARAYMLAVHLHNVQCAIDAGRIVGEPWKATIWLTGHLSFENWPLMIGVTNVSIHVDKPCGDDDEIETDIPQHAVPAFVATFPDIQVLVLDRCEGDVWGLLEAVQPLGLRSLFVYECPGVESSFTEDGLQLEEGWIMADLR